MKTFFNALQGLVHSIRVRLALWFSLILAVVLTLFSVIVYLSQARDLRSEMVGRLEGRMEDMEHALRSSDSLAINTADLTESDVLVLFNESGQVTFQWGPLSETQITSLVQARLSKPTETILYRDVSAGGKQVAYGFMLSPRISEQKVSGFVLIGAPLDPGGRLEKLLLTLFLGSLVTLTVALLGGFWLADRAMRPVADITRTARLISETDLSHRLNLKQRDEIGQLADTFDSMLARLEAAFNRQRQFTADASHELRTPLTIVNLEVNHALAAPRKPAEYQRALRVIQAENEFMSKLVNDLLLLARMDTGQVALMRQRHDLADLSLEALERLSPLAASQQVRLEAGDLPETPVLGDRQYLIQMLTNLIENAIKYSTRAERAAVVRIETGISEDGTQAWVRVSDNGAGIPAEHLPHIFERFYRADNVRTAHSGDSSTSGSGLGLAIVQWIARIHGGDVRAESRLGEGSTFIVHLPLAK